MQFYNVSQLDKNLIAGVEKLQKRYKFNVSETGRLLISKPTDEDILNVTADNKQIVITHKTKASFFRGLGHVVESEQNNVLEFSKTEQIQFSFNGLMYDSARNGVLNVERTKDFLEMMAIMGHTVYMPYIEDIYELDEPFFGYMRGRYSIAELKEIDDYAFDLGIELIPCIQTLAHMGQFTRWEAVKSKYTDIDDILIVNTDETRALIDKMFKTLSQTVRSNTIHVGMDEAYNLGRGRYLDRHGYTEKAEIMRKHLQDVVKIAEKYNLTTIMWDDMFFRDYAQPKSGDNIKPEQIRLMYWDYYNNFKDHYIENLDLRLKIDKNAMFAGGAWRWVGYAPHHTKTIVSTNAALEACKEKNIKNVITTSWSDDSSECPADTCMLGVALFAEHGYNRNVDMEEFKKRLKFFTGLSYETYMMEEQFDMIPGIKDCAHMDTPSKYLFYQDPLCGAFEYHAKVLQDKGLTAHFENIEKYFVEHLNETDDPKIKTTLNVYKCFAQVMTLKWNLGLNLIEAYKNKDKAKLSKIITEQINPLINYLHDFKWAVYEQWYMNNKGNGFEILDIRYGGMISRLNTTIRHLQKYIDGTIDRIPELEEERIKIKDSESETGAIHFNQYAFIASAAKMQWA